MRTIGVFDSGIGGLSVARAIERALPDCEVIFRNDKKNIPYGTKTKEELHQLVLPILVSMIDDGCEVIVIACNTVTTTLIKELREEIKVPLIGMEPMVKPAAHKTQTKIIAIFATPTTLASQRYTELKNLYAQGVRVLEPDCSEWSLMIETSQVDEEKIRTVTNQVCERGADVIVLGCTHYHWIEELIKDVAGNRAQILQPEGPVIERLRQVLTN